MTSTNKVPAAQTLCGYPIEPPGTQLRCWTGSSHPFGATVTDNGVNFALYSANATAVTLLLFNNPGDEQPVRSITLNTDKNRSFNIWHAFIEGAKHGMGYAYRVDGPHDHRGGHRFDPEKVLIDPYARANNLSRWKRVDACVAGDNLTTSMRSVVINTTDYDWEGDQPLQTPMAQSVIYEMHVGGFTKSPTSGVQNPGTFLGLIEKSLTYKILELLPSSFYLLSVSIIQIFSESTTEKNSSIIGDTALLATLLHTRLIAFPTMMGNTSESSETW